MLLTAMLLAAMLLTNAVVAVAVAAEGSISHPAAVVHAGAKYTLTNGYVSVTFEEKLGGGGALSSLKGDFDGQGVYGEELLAGTGYTLDVAAPDGRHLASSAEAQDGSLSVKIVSKGPATASILIEGLGAGGATETWALTLNSGDRGFELNTTGSMIADLSAGAVVKHSLLASPLSVYGYYPADGVVQMMNAARGKTHMPSARPLARIYMMGGVNPSNTNPKLSDGTQGAIDIQRDPAVAVSGQVTMLASNPGLLAKTAFYEVVAGNISAGLDTWGTGGGPDGVNGSCVSFRQTGSCSATGPRQPSGDKDCETTIPCNGGNCPSGYCECKGGVKRHPVSCKPGSHAPFTCASICAQPDDEGLVTVRVGTNWKTSTVITPNNHNFPAGSLTTGPNLPIDDLTAVMAGIYGSAPGCLCTFPNSPACPGMEGKHEKLGQIATTIARPDRGYAGTYNYFDPDNFFSMSALIYSGEPFLQEQARTVIERSGSWLCIGEVEQKHKCTYGQLPHHFVGDTPTFLALSGATQTGPNTFWTKSALQYARNSGNLEWLKAYMPTLRASSAFCFDLISPDNHLLLAPGSLMVDVFVRQNYTADSNAMMVGFLNEFADAEEAVGNVTGATTLRAKATAMSTAMAKYLWDTDHFVTQVNPDPGPAGPRGISTAGMDCAKAHNCRDFVDYDSNVIAVAHGVGGLERGKTALARIDAGKAAGSSSPVQKCTAMQGGGPQWTSEIWYGPGDTTGFPHGNVGDSCSAMGRIAYFDALARKKVGDAASFNTQLSRMQKDLLFYTWMHERYGCDGKMQTNRTAAYFEYPSTVAILNREIRYGIEIDFKKVTVKPLMLKPGPFSYNVGNVNVDYHPSATTKITVPTPNGVHKEYSLHGMAARGAYTLRANGACAFAEEDASVTATEAGVLTFVADGSCGGVEVKFAQQSGW